MKRSLTCGLLAVLWLAATLFAGQQAVPPTVGSPFPSYKAPRLDGHPDLNGIWQAFVTANWDVQDHEAQAGPHPEIMGAYGAGPRGRASSKAVRFRISRGRSRKRRRTSTSG